MGEIIPAILPKTPEELTKGVNSLPSAIQLIHLDVLEEEVWTDFPQDFEAHLMVENPDPLIERYVKRGAKRIIIHTLSGRTARYEHACEIGLGVELHVPLEEIYPFLEYVDFVQLMSIAKIGEQGHPLDERIFDRIKEVRERFPALPISIDGGVNTENYQKLLNTGANRLVVGSGFQELWTLLNTK